LQPGVARLTVEDPSEELAGAHVYRYADADPASLTDPAGLTAAAAAPAASEWIITNGAKAIRVGRAFAGLLNPITWLPVLLLYEDPVGKDDTFLPEEKEAIALQNMPCKDPCKGLLKMVIKHLVELAKYKRSPDAQDNRGFLAGALSDRREK
jgi:hypothetical protein